MIDKVTEYKYEVSYTDDSTDTFYGTADSVKCDTRLMHIYNKKTKKNILLNLNLIYCIETTELMDDER